MFCSMIEDLRKASALVKGIEFVDIGGPNSFKIFFNFSWEINFGAAGLKIVRKIRVI